MWYTVLISDVKILRSKFKCGCEAARDCDMNKLFSLGAFLKIQQSPGSTPLESKRIDPIQLNWLGQTP